jgi:hypothetical protein
MRVLLVLFLFIIKGNLVSAQDSTDFYIRNLSWQSLFLKINYGTRLRLTNDAEKIIAAKSNKTVKKLYCEISNGNKSAVIHIILSRMFEPKSSKINANYIYKSDSMVGISYLCNKLKWEYNIKEDEYSLDPKDIEWIKRYWSHKIPFLKNYP